MLRFLASKIIQFFSNDYYLFSQVNFRLLRGVLALQSRTVDLKKPLTWEFSCFSQNGEDGILQVLLNQLIRKDFYFVELGCGSAVENNTSYLALVSKYEGLMIDANSDAILQAKKVISSHNLYVSCKNIFITMDNLEELTYSMKTKSPDVLSLDIDGIDYYVLSKLLELNVRPKILVVEYNSVFGADKPIVVKYKVDFDVSKQDARIFFGASIGAWRKLLEAYGYSFVTVERSGTNAFFILSDLVDKQFLENIQGSSYEKCKVYDNFNLSDFDSTVLSNNIIEL